MLVLPLTASAETLRSRKNEPGDPTFFIEVGRAARRWARQLGYACLPPLSTDDRSPDALAELVIDRVQLDSFPRASRRPQCVWS